MPELPEVETTKRGLSPHIVNSVITDIDIYQPKLRYPVNHNIKELLSNNLVTGISRRAKYLLWHLQSEKNTQGILLCHLGMSGSMRVSNDNIELKKHDHVVIKLNNGLQVLYHDPRRFGFLLHYNAIEDISFLQKLGPEPLSDDFDAQYLYRLSRNKTQSIKQFIMNQHIVVGVGNIYASESLFLAGISPKRAAGKISLQRYESLVFAIKKVLQQSIEQGGTTLKDFVSASGEPGYFAQTLNVYGRENMPCLHCSKHIRRIVQQNRASYYCSACQK